MTSDLAAVIRTLLAERAEDASICPSEVARVAAGDGPWRPLMPAVREAAARLATDGEVEVTQRGRTVDPATARGPIRIRRPR